MPHLSNVWWIEEEMMHDDLGAAMQGREDKLAAARAWIDDLMKQMGTIRPKHKDITRCPNCDWKGHATYWEEDQNG